VKLGDVLKKERERKGVSIEETASQIGITVPEYQEMEAGESPAEIWGPRLALIAIELETPTSRLLSDTGKAADTQEGQAGKLIEAYRTYREKSIDQMAEALGISADEYRAIEQGNSPLEQFGPRLLGFAEVIEQPIFNLFYPCGLPLAELTDYP